MIMARMTPFRIIRAFGLHFPAWQLSLQLQHVNDPHKLRITVLSHAQKRPAVSSGPLLAGLYGAARGLLIP